MNGIAAPRELVLASAGSGKTFRISSRLIGLLAAGEDPDQLLAATFTRKAAGEILDRVLTRLARAVLTEEAARKLAEEAVLHPSIPIPIDTRGWGEVLERTVRSLHRLNIGTLDAFFMRAATAFEAELGLPTGWRIPDEPTVRRLASRALLEVLASGNRLGTLDLVRQIERGAPPRSIHDKLVSSIEQLLEIEGQIDPDAADAWGVFGEIDTGSAPTREEVDRLARSILEIAPPTTCSDSQTEKWSNALAKLASLVAARDWQKVLDETLCKNVAADKLKFHRVAISGKALDCIEEVLRIARRALGALYGVQLRALGELTRAYKAVYHRIQHEQGLYGFGDITRLIASGDPLGDRADLYYRMDARTRHILLDEFQDTSMPQWEALAPIVDEVLSDDGRAAIIVADPKQSIYGWRGADPDIVHRVGDRYSLPEVSLAKSWRSSPVVLGFVNKIFENLPDNGVQDKHPIFRPVAEQWIRDFQLHEAAKTDLPGFVSIEVGPADEGRGSKRPRLLEHAASRVAELARAHPGFTIGVLTRTNDAVARIFLELRNLDVEVSQEGGNPVTDSAACEAILALLRFADHPGDTISRYHVAASPLGEVLGYTDHRDESGGRSLAARIRRRLLQEGYGRTIADLARKIVGLCDQREARRLSRLVELGFRYDARASLRPTDFVRLAESERIEDRIPANVRVMTVHQSKGLEFDIVVLPQLDQSVFGGGSGPPVVAWRKDPAARISAVYPQGRYLQCVLPELIEPHEQHRSAILRDALSGLYVALTRSRYALHIVLAPDGKNGVGTALTASRIVREALAEPGEKLPAAVTGKTLYSIGDPDWSLDPNAHPGGSLDESEPRIETSPRVLLRREARRRVVQRQTPSGPQIGARIEVRELLDLDGSGARDRGSLIHAWFEQIEWVDDFVATDVELLDIARATVPNLSGTRLQGVLADFRGWLANPTIRDGLSRARYAHSALVERELAFLRRVDGALIEGVVDRLVISLDGGRPVAAEVMDFKSDRTGADPDAVAKLTHHYSGQIRAYIEAVAEMYSLPLSACTGSLVFLEAGRIEPVKMTDAPPDPTVDITV